MSQRTTTILRIMLDTPSALTSEELAEAVGVSSRTVKREMKAVTDLLELHGATISSGNAGYEVEVTDPKAFGAFREQTFRSQDPRSDEDEEVRDIVRALVTSPYVTQDDLASMLFVSRSTVGKIMRQVRALLDEHQIVLSSRPHYGYYLIANEETIRNFMVDYLLRDVAVDDYRDDLVLARCRSYDEFLRRSRRLLAEGGHSQADPRTDGILKYLVVTGARCAYGQRVESSEVDPLVAPAVVTLARKLVDVLGDEFGCHIGVGDTDYLSLLLGNVGANDESERQLDAAFFENVVDDCIAQVRETYGRDFTGDEDLRRGLISHLYSTCSRMRINVVLNLPMLAMVKSQYSEAYDYAVLCGHLLLERYGLQSNEDSLGYIAMHFAAAIERQNAKSRFRVVVVCESGFGMSQLLTMRITTRLTNVEVVAVLPLAELRTYDLTGVTLVISTVPLSDVDVPIPHMVVTPFFDDNDAKRVSDYLSYFKDIDRVRGLFTPTLFFPALDVHDKAEALEEVCRLLIGAGAMREADRASIYQREDVSSTEINPLVAMPHCLLGEGEKTAYAIFTTRRPVDWKHSDVQLIIVMLISKARDLDRQLFPLVYRLTADKRKVEELVRIREFDSFVDKLFENLPTSIVR